MFFQSISFVKGEVGGAVFVGPSDNVTRRTKYTIVSGDLSVTKTYKIQGHVELPAWQCKG